MKYYRFQRCQGAQNLWEWSHEVRPQTGKVRECCRKEVVLSLSVSEGFSHQDDSESSEVMQVSDCDCESTIFLLPHSPDGSDPVWRPHSTLRRLENISAEATQKDLQSLPCGAKAWLLYCNPVLPLVSSQGCPAVVPGTKQTKEKLEATDHGRCRKKTLKPHI